MARLLSSADFARIEAATRTFLSPLAAPDPDAWRAEAMRTFSDALGAEGGTFFLPGRPGGHLVHGANRDHSALLDAFCGPVCSGSGPGPDPMLDLAYKGLTRQGIGTGDIYSTDHALGGAGLSKTTLFYHEVLAPFGTVDAQTLMAPVPGGIAHLTATHLRRTPEPGEHLPLLGVLLPALKAGLDTLARLDARRHALDHLAEPLVAYDADGREAHRNAALTEALAADPERERVEGALRVLAQALRPLAFGGGALAPVSRTVTTARARYTLRGVLVGAGAFGGTDAFLVTVAVDGAGPPLPSADLVRARHGLTKREAEVALLLAEGLSNEALAERLFVSKHTARHHVEAVLSKLDVSSRAAVSARLLQPLA